MSKVQITNKTMQTIPLLVKGRKDNETKQLLPKQSIVVDRTKLSGHEKNLERLGRVVVKAVDDIINV